MDFGRFEDFGPLQALLIRAKVSICRVPARPFCPAGLEQPGSR